MKIGQKEIGAGHPCFVIAEAGVNHNGELSRALEMIDVAADAGADAVKFQTFQAEALVANSAPKAGYQCETTDPDESQLDMLRALELSRPAHMELQKRCKERGIEFLSTPFEHASADFLDELGMSAIKVPSGEITNLPFLRHLATKAKPMIVSTGMSTMAEVDAALNAIRAVRNNDIVVLHCVTSYPCPPEIVNLRAMETMRSTLGVDVGYSDHTVGIEISIASATLGACVIEKHFTLDRNLPGPDHRASIEPDELCQMIRSIRNVGLALGHGRKEPAEVERANRDVIRKSLVATVDIQEGEIITDQHVAIVRPGTGLAPDLWSEVLGLRAVVNISSGTPLTFEMLS